MTASTTQATLGESADEKQCEAIANSTGRRCEHDALLGVPYCPDHYHLLDEVDMRDHENSRLSQ